MSTSPETLPDSVTPPVTGESPRLRIMILATPRTGTTWLRHLFGNVYAMPTSAVRQPADLDWSNLPERCVVSIHWHPVPEFVSQLQEHGWRVVTLSRHPLDVLISILHFASAGKNSEEHTSDWLIGEAGDESGMIDAAPTSERFLNYATSPRAKALFSVSPEWSVCEGSVTVNYENLVLDPVAEMSRVAELLQPVDPAKLREAIEANTIKKLRAGVRNQHHWQGIAGIWKRLLPASVARRIMEFHRDYVEAFHYACDADESLDETRAALTWLGFETESIKREQRDSIADFQKLVREVRNFNNARIELDTARNELRAVLPGLQQLEQARLQLDETRQQLDQTRLQLNETRLQFENTRLQLDQTRQQLEMHRNEMGQFHTEIQKLDNARIELDAARNELRQTLQSLQKLDDARIELDTSRNELREAAIELQKLGTRQNDLQSSHDNVQAEVAGLHQRLAEMQALVASFKFPSVAGALRRGLRAVGLERDKRAP